MCCTKFMILVFLYPLKFPTKNGIYTHIENTECSMKVLIFTIRSVQDRPISQNGSEK